MARTRTPVSAHGRLFGGDSMYEVLVEVARLRRRQFHAFEIAQRIDRHPSQVQRDLARLTAIGVLEEIEARGAAHLMRRRTSRLARAVVSLPLLIESEIGDYRRGGALDASGET
jgi:hypothetical protein